jgi:predicted MFS family arabinose efflux permease
MALIKPTAAPNGITARILLSFLATAGLYYVNIMPALIDGLREGLHFSNKEAGLVGSLNMYGGACGALAIALLSPPRDWRAAARRMLLGLIVVDCISAFVTVPAILMGVRFVHGVIGGALVGLSFAIFARTEAPDRTFGMLLIVQAFAGGIGVMFLPLLVPVFGTRVLFAALIAFSLVTLAMLAFLDEYKVKVKRETAEEGVVFLRGPFLLALCAVFAFQAANMGLYAFIIGLGKNAGLEIHFISQTLGAANWIAMLGALLVVLMSTRFGVALPILTGIVLTFIGCWALFDCGVSWVWIASNVVTSITWNLVIAYLLGMCARFDAFGRTAVWGGFASKMGLAFGPMLGAYTVGESRYSALIAVSLVLLALAFLCAAIPALMLDRQRRREQHEASLACKAV